MFKGECLNELAIEFSPLHAAQGRDAIAICFQLPQLQSESKLIIREGRLNRQLLNLAVVEAMEAVLKTL